ncbi:MAG: PPOX class F420-dependent oxidoreductase [Chloroflexaceae bacterium]|jgi:hypothetical protein|nr:PPOX class F420-dependent oxidoreductase [Chloroflexaceae bacterium]
MTQVDTTTNDNGYFAPLHNEEFIVLTTYRKNGDAMPTTVWFAEAAGRLYITTSSLAGKTKRISNNPHVLVTPSDRIGNTHGTTLPAQARVLPPDEFACAAAALRQKYGQTYDAMTSQMDANRQIGSRVFLEVIPPA